MHTGISYRVIARVVAGLFLFAMAAGMVDAYAVVPLFAALLCAFLFHVRLVPRSISTVGLVGYVSLFVSALLVLFGAADTSTFGMLLYLPGAVFEIVLFPGWLIVKGFSSPTSGPTRGR